MGDRRDTADESGISPTRGRFISPSKGRPYIGHGWLFFFSQWKVIASDSHDYLGAKAVEGLGVL